MPFVTYKMKNVNIYPNKESGIYYASYRTKVNDPMRGEVIIQRNVSTGLKNKQMAQKFANQKRQDDIDAFAAGKNKTPNIAHPVAPTCGEIIERYLQSSDVKSAKNVVKAFCILITEGLGQVALDAKERQKFVAPINLSTISPEQLISFRDQTAKKKLGLPLREANNIHFIMRTGKSIFGRRASDYYRDLRIPSNIEEWSKVSKPVRGKGQDESFQPIDSGVLADMDKAAQKDSPEDSVMLQFSREQAEFGHDAEAVRWRNAYAAYWVMRRCGCRNIEVQNLRWEWFEVSPSTIHLAIIKREYWKPKYGGRRLKISEDLYTTLLTVFGPRKEGPEGYVLQGNDRDRYEGCNEFVNKFVRRYLPGRQKGAYELRKQFGSEIAAEYDIATAAYMLGHKGLETAYKHYYTSLKPVRAL